MRTKRFAPKSPSEQAIVSNEDRDELTTPQAARKSRSRRLRATALALLVASAVAVPELASPGVAMAGTNGQQIAVDVSPSAAYIQIHGHNQNNQVVTTPVLWDGYPGQYAGLAGWWWKGSVTIYIGMPSTEGTLWVTKSCNVPTSQSSNWTYCGPYGD